ncbi:MAG TPA: AAA-like domain-containing protein, partial [Chthonomonadaceae bacterium]|nr:AAA-like domain-containing protein [Chthonomonadaceae bacterium]
MTITTDFYITGGTLPVNASSYVTRQADRELYDNLLRGQFCYVLNTRQMGKSSLMVRIAERLRAEGVDVVTLDLTAIGQNVTPQQWYEGLLSLVGEYFGREDALQQFWGEYKNLGPMQRFLWALQQAVLPHVERLVLFVDEIDAVRSLPFSTDEFFAGIRECHNRRAIDPVFHRLTFCLIGVATPSDLISNARISPFNIGKPILLTDFTSEEAAPLAEGLPGGQAVLEHVLYWTGGHPYMTQRLCRALAEYAVEKRIVRIRRRDVASLCCRLFLKQGACDTDDNLAFVRNRLLRSQADPAALLDFYKQVWLGRRVKDDETNQLCVVLKLSGVCRAEKGLLKVRNRIYTQVFDKAWVLRHMPYAELRRQRAAYRAGVLRTSLIGSAFVGLVGALAVTAVQEAHLADVNRSTAMEAMRRETQRSQASDKALVAAKRALYVSNVALAAQVWQSDDGPASTVQKLLASCDPPVDPSLLPTSCELLLCYDNRRGFDGLYVASRLIHTSVAGGFGAPGDGVQAIFTPEEDILMLDGDARLHRFQVGPRQRPEASRMVWNAVVQSLPVIGDERDPPLALKQRYAHFIWARLAQDGRTLEVGLTDGSVRVLDARSRAELGTQRGVAMP